MTIGEGLRQAAFAEALLSPGLRPPEGLKVPAGADAAHRFGVYRNNVFAGLTNALASRFPVVKRLVGDAFFAVMARIYITANPPRSPLMFRYGDSFPAFIKRFPPAASVPYLADVAWLEYLRGEAYHAADAEPIAARQFARLSGDELATARLVLHPSTRILDSAFPIVSIWRAHQYDDVSPITPWISEAALIARPELTVEVHLLPAGVHAFLAAVGDGASIGEAIAIAAEDPYFDLAQAFAFMLEARIVVDLR